MDSELLEGKMNPVTILGLTGKYYYIWSSQFYVPLCWDNKVLVFTTEYYARHFAESCLTSASYVIVYKELQWNDGYINADGLLVKQGDKKNSDGSWSCVDYLAKAE